MCVLQTVHSEQWQNAAQAGTRCVSPNPPANICRAERRMQLALPRQVSALIKTTHVCKGGHTGICFHSSCIQQYVKKKVHNKRKMPILKAKESISKLHRLNEKIWCLYRSPPFFFLLTTEHVSCFLSKVQSYSFFFSALTHQKDGIFKTSRGRK